MADLVPHRALPDQSPSRFVRAARISQALSGVPDWDSTAFEEEQRALDARVDDETRDPWDR